MWYVLASCPHLPEPVACAVAEGALSSHDWAPQMAPLIANPALPRHLARRLVQRRWYGNEPDAYLTRPDVDDADVVDIVTTSPAPAALLEALPRRRQMLAATAMLTSSSWRAVAVLVRDVPTEAHIRAMQRLADLDEPLPEQVKAIVARARTWAKHWDTHTLVNQLTTLAAVARSPLIRNPLHDLITLLGTSPQPGADAWLTHPATTPEELVTWAGQDPQRWAAVLTPQVDPDWQVATLAMRTHPTCPVLARQVVDRLSNREGAEARVRALAALTFSGSGFPINIDQLARDLDHAPLDVVVGAADRLGVLAVERVLTRSGLTAEHLTTLAQAVLDEQVPDDLTTYVTHVVAAAVATHPDLDSATRQSMGEQLHQVDPLEPWVRQLLGCGPEGVGALERGVLREHAVASSTVRTAAHTHLLTWVGSLDAAAARTLVALVPTFPGTLDQLRDTVITITR